MFFFLSLLRLILDSDGSVRGDLDIARIGDECVKHGCSCDGVGELNSTTMDPTAASVL